MQLSRRMQMLTDMVTNGHRLADIGTDHGYLPIYLCQEGRIPSAIAMDVRKGPLMRAKEHIEEAGLSGYIQTRLSDGLDQLRPGEADTILIAGMGGPLLVRILLAHPEVTAQTREFILQPQSQWDETRAALAASGFSIKEERMVCEEGKYYAAMRAVRGEAYSLSEVEAAFGPCLLAEGSKVLREYLDWEWRQCGCLMETLLQVDNANTARRRRELEHRMQLILQARERIEQKKEKNIKQSV